ncbi:MAG: hypothetical protein AAB477_02930 [Patescibacteria group bacterium]
MKIIRSNKYNLLSKLASYGFIFVIAFTFIVPLAFAVDCTGVDKDGKATPPGCTIKGGDTGPKGGDTGPKGGDTGVKNIKINTGITNPLGDKLDTIPKFIEAILDFVLLIGVPIVTLAIIYTGFLFVTAQGNSEKLKKAKQTLLYTLVGAALLLGSYVISEAIVGTVADIKSTT